MSIASKTLAFGAAVAATTIDQLQAQSDGWGNGYQSPEETRRNNIIAGAVAATVVGAPLLTLAACVAGNRLWQGARAAYNYFTAPSDQAGSAAAGNNTAPTGHATVQMPEQSTNGTTAEADEEGTVRDNVVYSIRL